MLCCGQGEYVVGGGCMECIGNVYEGGLYCCPFNMYMDYAKSPPKCVKIGTGDCLDITFESVIKVCCPSSQFYNIDI